MAAESKTTEAGSQSIVRLTDGPLVSVGIATYNRPDGLRRTLDCIVRQTYHKLEIIVSDNCSPSDETAAVVREFMTADPRIKFFRQESNIGMIPNMQFVLRKAQGDFYMWAADDDEWDERFIEVCLANMGDAGSFITGYRFLNRFYGTYFPSSSVNLPPETSRFEALQLFFKHYFVHVFYALHKRSAIQFVLEDAAIDFYDSYFAIRLILQTGLVIKQDKCLFTAGMDTPEYEKKAVGASGQRFFGYREPLKKVSALIWSSKDLRLSQKLLLLWRWWTCVLAAFAGHEKKWKPFRAFVAMSMLRLISLPRKIRNRVLATE